MPRSLASSYPSLTSESGSITSSEFVPTASEHVSPSPVSWRGKQRPDETDRGHRFQSAKRLLSFGSGHYPLSIPGPANADELKQFSARHNKTQTAESHGQSTRRKPRRSRDEAAASLHRSSRASAASTTGLASKHSSLGPLPIFTQRTHHYTLSRQSSISSTLAHAADNTGQTSLQPEQDYSDQLHTASLSTTPPSRSSSTRRKPTLASLFQSASRKALRRDEFRKDSYSKQDDGYTPAQSVPTTPRLRRFLGLKFPHIGETLRSAKSTPAPPPLPTAPVASVPVVPVPPTPASIKPKEPSAPPTPILKRKRSSLPNPPPKPMHEHAPDDYQDRSLAYETPSRAAAELADISNHTIRRSKSDSRHPKRSHSPGQTTSIRVPGPPPPHHPHPHPYFSCGTPIDRALMSLPSFDFEPPVTRPSTPGQSQEFLPLEKGKRYRSKMTEGDMVLNPEIKSVIAAGTEARRERRAPSRERLRVIGGMHRQILPELTHEDDQLSPDPYPDQRASAHPSAMATPTMRTRSPFSHGLLPFESPASTPYGSLIELPLTPPPSRPRRSLQAVSAPKPTAAAPASPVVTRAHHRHFSSSATAVAPPAPPLPPKNERRQEKRPSYDEKAQSRRDDYGYDQEMGFLKGSTSPRLYAGDSPVKDRRYASLDSYDRRYDQHKRKGSNTSNSTSLNHNHRLDSSAGHDSRGSPTSYRYPPPNSQHAHSKSLSGATTVHNPYLTPQSMPGLGITLYPEASVPSHRDRYYDLSEAMKLSIGDSRYRSFERAMRKYNEQAIPLRGKGGLFERVERLLDDAVRDGLPLQTARRYNQTFQDLLVESDRPRRDLAV